MDGIKFVQSAIETYLAGSSDEVNNKNDKLRGIFELEQYLEQLKVRLELGYRLDVSIDSKSIRKTIGTTKPSDAFKPKDFQFTFLDHIIQTYHFQITVHELVDTYIQKHKDNFTAADIVKTNTGMTRCKTNLRFALNDLRDLGLILENQKDGKRSWAPSFPSILIMMIALAKENLKERFQRPIQTTIPGAKVEMVKTRSGKIPLDRFDDKIVGLINQLRHAYDESGKIDYIENIGKMFPRQTLERTQELFNKFKGMVEDLDLVSKLDIESFRKLAVDSTENALGRHIQDEKLYFGLIDDYNIMRKALIVANSN